MNKTQRFIIAIGTFLYATVGLAGTASDSPVVLNFELKTAQGSQTSARFSDNDIEQIGCGATVRILDDGSTLYFGFCQATDANGVDAACFTDNQALVGAINAVANFGFIRFSWNDNDECLSIRNSTQSNYLPNFYMKKSK